MNVIDWGVGGFLTEFSNEFMNGGRRLCATCWCGRVGWMC